MRPTIHGCCSSWERGDCCTALTLASAAAMTTSVHYASQHVDVTALQATYDNGSATSEYVVLTNDLVGLAINRLWLCSALLTQLQLPSVCGAPGAARSVLTTVSATPNDLC
jgi:hypothetical protein